MSISIMSDVIVDSIDGFAGMSNISEEFTSVIIIPSDMYQMEGLMLLCMECLEKKIQTSSHEDCGKVKEKLDKSDETTCGRLKQHLYYSTPLI